jgi:3-deoxy-D-manno-octulosonic-acid transferase
LLADTRGEMGLWYRLATIAMMGSSLLPGMGGSDPNEPASHGAAIIYGPNVGRYLPSYRRYASAGGARIVRDADTLAAAVAHLIAADRSAAMAHAAWEVATVGAEVTDQILALLHDILDEL